MFVCKVGVSRPACVGVSNRRLVQHKSHPQFDLEQCSALQARRQKHSIPLPGRRKHHIPVPPHNDRGHHPLFLSIQLTTLPPFRLCAHVAAAREGQHAARASPHATEQQCARAGGCPLHSVEGMRPCHERTPLAIRPHALNTLDSADGTLFAC